MFKKKIFFYYIKANLDWQTRFLHRSFMEICVCGMMVTHFGPAKSEVSVNVSMLLQTAVRVCKDFFGSNNILS